MRTAPFSTFRHGLAACIAALLAAACGQSGPPPAANQVPPPVPSVAIAPPPASSANNVSGYKVEVARRVYQANSARIFTGKPPPLLRSIVVVGVVIDADGRLVSSSVYRDNGDAEARTVALASLQRAAPLPRPAAGVLRSGRLEYLESWLFRQDGKFQVRSIAEIQASE